MLASVGVAGAAATPASANSWGARVDGVEFGWVDSYGRQTEFAWAQASDATLAQLGASRVTSLACRAITDDAPFFAFTCQQLVKPWVNYWIGSEQGWVNHGHWVRFYPHASTRFWHGSW
jgi:hypothetical protein